MNCPNCAAVNEAGRKFCGECGTRLAVVCSSCGTANAPGTRFCGECGTALDGATAVVSGARLGTDSQGAAVPTAGGPFDAMTRAVGGGAGAGPGPIAERRLVTVLFADLVGFTTISEGRDPEEVRELLSRYFDSAREQIERYGGTVEKFIGDAVMAVWGAPTAHEDDAERGVRAALDVVDAVKDLAPGLQARAGVLTGEAAVTVGARGQGMVAGDLVNTSSRLQSAAPPGMVLVGEATKRATEGSIAYELAGEQLLKGKAAPVTAYHALRVVARRGGAGRGDKLEPPFVGRDSELRLLKDLFHTTSLEKRVRLVSVTGQAGIGKSRLVWELRKYGDGVAQDIFWHEGRSPAYGQGITFWALGEMVRARAQLLESDDPATTREKLAASVARWFPEGEERDRVERALQALLGVGEAPRGADELFGAWRLYFERMAEQFLVTMVFEDLHWADPGTLDFIDHVLEWSRNVPILIVTLARPTLLEQRPGWGAGRRNFLALDIEPLADAPMRELLVGLVPDLSEPAIRSIVARAEGIPLYAVETIRMLAADGRLRERDEGGFEPVGELGELAVPDSLHALIAARLDALNQADRSLVQDAAVLGQSFAAAGLGAVSGLDQATLVARLRDLVKADLLTEERDERSPERGQFAFVQALIREVAYSTLSLKDRRSRHLAAARFFESLGDDELAGALAAHYLAAFRATTDAAEARPLQAQARIALQAAADRADKLGAPRQGLAFLEQAMEVAADDAELGSLLERAAEAAWAAADYDRSLELAGRLRALREAMGDRSGMALAVALEAETFLANRQRERATQHATEALPQYEDLADDRNVLRLMSVVARAAALTRHHDQALQVADRTLAVAERLGIPDLAARMLSVKSTVAFFQGRLWEALALAEGARRLAEQHDDHDLVRRINGQLSNMLALDDPRATVEVERELIANARRQGRRENEIVTIGNTAEDVRRTGEWDWIIGELEGAIRDEDRNITDLLLEAALAMFHLLRGQISDPDLDAVIDRIDAIDDIDVAASADDVRATRSMLKGDLQAAATSFLKVADRSDLNAPYVLPKAGHAAILAGDATAAQVALDRLAALGTRGRAIEADIGAIHAGLAALAGDRGTALVGYRTARVAFRDLGLVYDVAFMSIIAATRLGADEPEVAGWLAEARTTFEQLRAQPFVSWIDDLSAGTGHERTRRPAAAQEASVSST
jgi:class 3 adenylate cyclase/DNA-binding MarR family transcriptional regulator